MVEVAIDGCVRPRVCVFLLFYWLPVGLTHTQSKLTACFWFGADKNKLITTFNDKTSTKRNVSIAPRELRKFHDLHILDVATGIEHILLFAVSKSNIYTSLDISSSDPNENFAFTETPVKARKSSIPGTTVPPPPRKNSKSSAEIAPKQVTPETRAPVLTKQTLESIYTDTVEAEQKSEPNVVTKETVEKTEIESKTVNEEVKSEKKLEPIQKDSTSALPTVEPVLEARIVQPLKTKPKLLDTEKPSVDQESETLPTETESLKEFEKLEMENSLGMAVAGVGDSIKTDVLSMVASGKGQMNEMKDDVVKTVSGMPQHMAEFAKTTIAPKIDDQIKQVTEKKNEILDDIFDEVKQSKQHLKQSIAQKLSLDGGDGGESGGMSKVEKTKEFLHDNMSEMDQILRSEKIKQELERDDRIEVLIDAAPQSESTAVEDRVKFIDNGVEVNNGPDIIQSMKDEIKEMDAEAEDQVMEIKEKIGNDLMGEKMGATKEAFVGTANTMANGELWTLNTDDESREVWRFLFVSDSKQAIPVGASSVPFKHIPLKYDLEEVDLDGDGDTERTTASIKSANTPTNNPFDGEDVDTMPKKGETAATIKESSSDGRVKRFLNEIKSNCKTADTVVESKSLHSTITSTQSINWH